KIVITGENRLDHRAAMLMAGCPAEKIVCTADMNETADLVDIEGVDSIYLIHDVLMVSRALSVRDRLRARIEGTEVEDK
ncbi:MAG: hypothetical protein J5744_08300, partial [Oscillospiraceae bacterium]|nr:hypothetical protein [Oscillospiraceae bacterium]